MRAYMHIFLNLMVPISFFAAIASVIYFNLNYDFSKALKLGILSGVMISLPVSLIAALVLLLIRKQTPIEEDSNNGSINTNIVTEEVFPDSKMPVQENLILLMDRKLAFEVARFSILDQKLGEATTKESKEKCTITLRSQDEIIQIISTSLTRHTAQLVLKAAQNSEKLHKIITYVKEKEHRFLQS